MLAWDEVSVAVLISSLFTRPNFFGIKANDVCAGVAFGASCTDEGTIVERPRLGIPGRRKETEPCVHVLSGGATMP